MQHEDKYTYNIHAYRVNKEHLGTVDDIVIFPRISELNTCRLVIIHIFHMSWCSVGFRTFTPTQCRKG